MSRTIRKYPHGIDLLTADEARRDGHNWHGNGDKFAKRHANRLSRRHWLNNRERKAVFARIVY